jgi:hypothetical protein
MKLVHWIVCATLLTAGCCLVGPDYQGITVAGDSIHLVADTKNIRDLLAAEVRITSGPYRGREGWGCGIGIANGFYT